LVPGQNEDFLGAQSERITVIPEFWQQSALSDLALGMLHTIW